MSEFIGKTEHVQNHHVLTVLRVRAAALSQIIAEKQRHIESLELAIALVGEEAP